MIDESANLENVGELSLLREVLLPCVTDKSSSLGDDCARVSFGNKNALWSMDPCPTPGAQLLDVSSPEVLGWYTALINLSDIAACGGTPLGLLVSLELPGETSVHFVKSFQKGLMAALSLYETPLLGGNVKSAPRFSATGTVIGEEGPRAISRKIDADECDAFLIGACGVFWASVVGHHMGWGDLSAEDRRFLRNALLAPRPQIAAGQLLASLPFQVACMDCSDGPANALYQLATTNSLDLVIPDVPAWRIPKSASKLLVHHNTSIENACFHFGDWQLACLVPLQDADAFKAAFTGIETTWMGRAKRGEGSVKTSEGRTLRRESLNENFRKGYNSIGTIEALVDRYLLQPVFAPAGI